VTNVRISSLKNRPHVDVSGGRKHCNDSVDVSNIFRKRLIEGQTINAPGAPAGYRYLDTIECPLCRYKSAVFRPRKSVWICSRVECSYKASFYSIGNRVSTINERVVRKTMERSEGIVSVGSVGMNPDRLAIALSGILKSETNNSHSKISRKYRMSVAEGYSRVIDKLADRS